MTEQRYALISVSDKRGLEDLGKALVDAGYEILSTGGTAKALSAAGLPVTEVAHYTGSPEIMDGRVKTLHPKIHGGLLADRANEKWMRELAEQGYAKIDFVYVNLYPLEQTIASGKPFADVIENIDIGGPTMLSSATKGRCHVLFRSEDIPKAVALLKEGREQTPEEQNESAGDVAGMIAGYRLAEARYRTSGRVDGMVGAKALDAKYGECPSHSSAFFAAGNHPLAASAFKLVAGSQPSHIGFTDVESAALTLVQIAAGWNLNFGATPKIAVAVKHGNACGVGVSDDPAEAVRRMVTSDPIAIHGGSVMVNFPVTEELATLMRRHLLADDEPSRLLDNVVAPSFDEGASGVLERKHGKCRMLENPALLEASAAMLPSAQYRAMRFGGFMRQDGKPFVLDLKHAEMKPMGELSDQQARDMVVAWAIGSTSVSNTITLVRDGMLVANAVGQQSRVRAAKLALLIAEESGHATITIEAEICKVTAEAAKRNLTLGTHVAVEKEVFEFHGCVAYSDSFFPFPDGMLVLANAGVKTIFASNGSVNDEKLVFPAAKEAGVSLWTLDDKICRGFARH